MWNSGSSSSTVQGQLSEYERQRLENIAQMSEQFSDLIENISTSALDLAKTTNIKANNSNVSTNGRKRTRNAQHYRQVKIFSKKQETSHSHPIRRSKRLIGDKRKRPEYDERSDDDDDKKPSKALRLKFPFFKKKEYAQRDQDYYKDLDDADFIDSDEEFMEYDDSLFRSKRKHKVSMNTHQVPVSLITQEMLKNITYSSCGKTYDAVNGTTCHQCRQKTLDQKSYCRYKKCRGIRGMFCGFCLGKRYGEDVAEVLLNKKWACPPCRGYCNCSICRRKRGRSPTGQLSQIAQAGGYKSVRHLLENTEGGVPEKDLSSDYDSDENNIKDDHENDISESIKNQSDNEFQNNSDNSEKKIKMENLNEEIIKTDQCDNLVIIENKNIPDDVNCNSSTEKQCFSGVLETPENEILEKNLIGDNKEDDKNDEDDERDEGEAISGSINNDLNDEIQPRDIISVKKTQIDHLNEEAMETEQNNDLVVTENINVVDDVNSKNDSIKPNSLPHLNGEMILNKLYQELFCF